MTKPLGGLPAVLGFLTLFHLPAQSQRKTDEISACVRLISQGKSDSVRTIIGGLRQRYPHDPGRYYLEGLLSNDLQGSIQYFSAVADSFPKSTWADDALVRLYECYRAMKKDSLVRISVRRLRTEHPSSPYLKSNYFISLDSLLIDPSQRPPDLPAGQEYAVQVGAFSNRNNAQRMSERLTRKGYKVDIFENFLDGSHLLYLVWVGTFKSESEAKQHADELKQRERIEGVVRARNSWKRW